MDNDQIFEILNKNSFFQVFSKEELEAICDLDHEVLDFSEGDYVIREGDIDNSFFILLTGEVSITKSEDPDFELNRLDAGSLFGDITFVAEVPRSTNVVVRENVSVLQINCDGFKKLDPGVVNKFRGQILKLLVNRLDEMNQSNINIKKEFDKLRGAFDTVVNGIEGMILELKE